MKTTKIDQAALQTTTKVMVVMHPIVEAAASTENPRSMMNSKIATKKMTNMKWIGLTSNEDIQMIADIQETRSLYILMTMMIMMIGITMVTVMNMMIVVMTDFQTEALKHHMTLRS